MINEDLLQFVPSAKFLRNCPVLFLSDCPQANEIDKEAGYSSQNSKREFEALQSAGIPRGAIHATYCFNFRPDAGELSAIFWRKGLPVEGYVPWGSEKNTFILDYSYNELKRLRDEIKQSKPKLIICSGKWALYFITGLTSYKDTAKSSYGTLMKWRASNLQLSEWWDYPTDCIVMPILPLNSKFQLPALQYLVNWDLKRIKKIATAAMKGNVTELMRRNENFYYPREGNAEVYFYIAKSVLLDLLHRAEHAINYKVRLSCDVETMSYAYIDCLCIAWSKEDSICIPFATKYSPHFWNEHQEVELYELLRALLLHPNVEHIGQNYSYDMQYFWRNMLMPVAPEYDTMIMNHVMFSTMDKNLGFLSSLYCQIHKWWKDEGKTNKGATDEERWIYNNRDGVTAFEIAEQLIEIYSNSPESIQEALRFQTKDVLPAITEVMQRGIRLDTVTRDKQIMQLAGRARTLELQFQEPFEEPVNLNSPIQMKEIFYELFRCKKVWKKVTDEHGASKNVLSLDEETLKELWETELLIRPFIDILLDYKRLTKTASGLKALTLDTDDRLRCSYNICGTDTHRFSSNANAFGTGTNLQVISKGKKLRNGEYLPNSKQLFLPDVGMEFFDIDLSAADAWNVAGISVCHELLDILESGEDLYTLLAREFFRDNTIQKSDRRRDGLKRTVHAGNYLGSYATIATRTGQLVIDVERTLKYYFGRFKEIPKWQVDLQHLVRHKQRITNVFGFQRWFFDQSLPTLMQIAAAWAPQCLSVNHSVITTEGFIPIAEITLQHKVAVWDIATKIITWEHPIEIMQGEALVVKTTGALNIEVTADHKIPFKSTNPAIKGYMSRKFANLPARAEIPLSGMLQDVGANWSEDKASLLAAFQADGCLDISRDSVIFEFHKQRKIDKLRLLLIGLSIPYTESLVRRGATIFYIPNISKVFDWDMKESGPYLLQIGSKALYSYLHSIKDWDGHFNEKLGVVEYCSSRRSHIDYLKIIVHLFGGRAREYAADMRSGKPCYKLNFNFNRIHAGLKYSTQRLTKLQPVHCISTRTGFFLTECNGEISVTGNCTTSNIINKGMVNIRNAPALREVQVLMQTHDSLAGQYPVGREDLKQGIVSSCSILLPYERPITIPVEIKTSTVSWGECL